MRLAICDDLQEQLDIINKATIEYFKSQQISVEIETFDKVFNFLDAHEKNIFDLVLLDICMPGMLGTEAAREIRYRGDKTEIIFLTTSNEFAIDAFEVHAVHYLLKPFTETQFHRAMDRAIHQMDDKLTKLVYLKCPKGAIYTLNKNTVSYIEADAHRQMVILLDGTTIETVQTLLELFQTLEDISPGQFITPYKGFIVNQHSIKTIESERIILKNGKTIPIPRRTFSMVKQTYFNYMFNGRK